jgi:hypothetical protein
VKSRLRTCIFVAGFLIPAILVPALSGCAKPVASSESPPSATAPQVTPVVPSPTSPEPAPTPPVVDNPSPPVVVEPEPAPQPQPVAETRRVDVVFFHRTQQCHSCEYAEVHVQSALEEYFADDLASGLVTSQSINMDDKKNSAIVDKYAAYSSQLFITTVKGDQEVTEEVLDFWNFIDDDEGFSQFMVDKVNQALASVE